MNVPATGRKKALIIIDVQPAFIKPHNKYIIPNILSLIEKVPYDFYVEAVFHAEKNSLWEKQQDWICPKSDKTHTIEQITSALHPLNPLKILKDTRSVFKGNKKLNDILNKNGIEELHLVGTETNDCVFASALDAFDNGFPVYIIEECCESATAGRHDPAVTLLRYQGMTNNRCLAKTIEIGLI